MQLRKQLKQFCYCDGISTKKGTIFPRCFIFILINAKPEFDIIFSDVMFNKVTLSIEQCSSHEE
jgi:hypothetical protein